MAEYAIYNKVQAHYYQHTVTGHVTTPPTCTDIGTENYVCNECAYTRIIPIAALDHDYILHAAKEPTETEIGWTEYKTCSRCDFTTFTKIPVANANADMDGDGGVTVKDVLLLLDKVLCGSVTDNGDMNGDGRISLIDIIYILKLSI